MPNARSIGSQSGLRLVTRWGLCSITACQTACGMMRRGWVWVDCMFGLWVDCMFGCGLRLLTFAAGDPGRTCALRLIDFGVCAVLVPCQVCSYGIYSYGLRSACGAGSVSGM